MFFNNLLRGYCIIPLSGSTLWFLGNIAYRKTCVSISKKTETHKHVFFSFYIVEKMKALQTPFGDLPLPDRALVIVLPFVIHGWTNEFGATNESFVHDLTPLHQAHVIVN